MECSEQSPFGSESERACESVMFGGVWRGIHLYERERERERWKSFVCFPANLSGILLISCRKEIEIIQWDSPTFAIKFSFYVDPKCNFSLFIKSNL